MEKLLHHCIVVAYAKVLNLFTIYGNLEFFGFLLPSYCVNKHFNTMDIFLIKYISGFYPFLLFILFIALTNLVYVKCCRVEKVARFIRNGYMRWKFKINRKGSTVNGLATLWTLVFTKFALMSGLILSQETLSGSENSNTTVRIAWLNGNIPYFGKNTSALCNTSCHCFAIFCDNSSNQSFVLSTCASDYGVNPRKNWY